MTIQSQCLTCKHLDKDKSWSCNAYKNIPDRIMFNQVVHNEIQDDQEGRYMYSGDFPIEDVSVYRYFEIA